MAIVLLLLCTIVAFYDLLFRRVPNWLLIIAITVHAGWLLVTGQSVGDINGWQSLAGGLVGLLIFIPFYYLKAMGAGDVKIFSLFGFLLGPQMLLPIWLIGSVLAGIHAVAWYMSTTPVVMASATWHRIQATVLNSQTYQTLLKQRAGRRGIPFAAYLAIAAIVASTG